MSKQMLLNTLRNDQKWAELDALSHLKADHRFNTVRRWFLAAVEKHDEKGAAYFNILLIHAVQDMAGDEECAARQTIALAVELFSQLPPYKTEKDFVYDQFENRKGITREKDTLVDLKKAMLKQIAIRWQLTKDRDEAISLAGFLVKAAQTKNNEQVKWVTEALHAATEIIRHRERTLLLMGRMAAEAQQQDPARKLLTAIMRTLDVNEIALLTPLFVQLPFDTLLRESYSSRKNFLLADLSAVPMLDAVEREAESYREMLMLMRNLKETLKLKKGEIRSFRPSFPQNGVVELSIGIQYGWVDRGQEENAFHDLFADLRDQIQAWLAACKEEKKETPRIKLHAFRPVQHGEPKLIRNLEIL